MNTGTEKIDQETSVFICVHLWSIFLLHRHPQVPPDQAGKRQTMHRQRRRMHKFLVSLDDLKIDEISLDLAPTINLRVRIERPVGAYVDKVLHRQVLSKANFFFVVE